MRNGRNNFHPRKFIGNNIAYRISASAALSRYKESQTFILNQLAFNPFHEFSTTSKEILLFKYDIWFDFANELEQFLLINMNNITVDTAQEIIQLADIRVKYYKETLRNETELIDQGLFEEWNKSHIEMHKYFKTYILELFQTDLKAETLISAIIDALIKILNHTLYELQELDIIFFSDVTPVFNLDELSCSKVTKNIPCLIFKRILALRKIRYFDEIIIKNYLEASIPFNMTNLYLELENSNIKYTVI